MRYGVVVRLRACVAALVVAGVSLFALTGSASAETYSASNTTQFVEAVGKANANPGANTIVLSGGAYVPLSTVRFTNTTGLQTVEGPASAPGAKIEGTGVEPFPGELFVIGQGVSVTFNNLAVAFGGGSGTPAILDAGTLNLEKSLISGNKGPGVLVGASGTAVVRNSTLSDGGDFGMVDDGSASFFNATVAFNKSGGVENRGKLSLTNTIVAENTGSGDCAGAANSSDHSLDSNGSCGVGALSGVNPLLQTSGLNDGGPTQIHSLKPGSPAIDAGDELLCPATDQRGFPRPDVPGTPCDIGADEYSATPPTIKVENVTAVQTSPSGAAVKYSAEATATDSVIRSFGCTPASGSTFPVGTTTVTCTATDGHENTATATFQVTVLLHIEFTNWVFSGFITPKKLNQPITLPEGSTFNGSAAINPASGSGSVTGHFAVPPFSSTLKILGIGASVGLEITQVGTTEGSIEPSTVEGDIALSLPTKTNIAFTTLQILGLKIPTKCKTAEPVSFNLLNNLTVSELLSTGSHFTGTTTIPTVTCEGTLGGVEGPVLSALFSGPNNPYSLAIAPPA